MKGRNAIFFSIAVLFCSWLALGVFVKAVPVVEYPENAAPPGLPPPETAAGAAAAPPPVVEAEAVALAGPEPVVEAGPEPVVEAVPEPVAEAASEPVAEAAPEPVAEAAPEPVVGAAGEPIVVAAPEPVPDAGPEPVAEAAPEPVVGAAGEPIVVAAPEPVPDAGPEPEPAPDAGPEPEPEGVPEPAPIDEDVGGEEDVEEAESESESESDSEDSDSDSESDSDTSEEPEPEPYAWMEEWQRRIVELNLIVYRLQGENGKLQHEVHAYDKELQAIQMLEASLSNEVETWLKGMQFPGLARVHDAIGIQSDKILNSVGEEADDCNDALGKGHKKPGVYLLNPADSAYNVRALCVNGWTVVQRRFDGSEDFNRDFDDYMAGFGNFSGEFFIGLDNLHRMAKGKEFTLRVDAKGASGKWYYGVYEDFKLSDEKDDYRLSIGNMSSGNYFDGFENSREQQFSSRDRDNDQWRGGNCAGHFGGGWWSDTCSTNLNQMWCRTGCLRWADKRVISSIIRIKPSEAVVDEDLSENPNPGGLSLDEIPA